MSPDIQNELLECAASLLLRKIKKELHESTYFAILADEYKDESKSRRGPSDLLTRLIWLQRGYRKESLKCYNLWIFTHLFAWLFVLMVHQWCWETKGECMFFWSKNSQGLFNMCTVTNSKTWCYALLQKCQEISAPFLIRSTTYSYMSGACQNARFMQLQKDLHPDRKQYELERATDVRWSSKSGSVSKIGYYSCLVWFLTVLLSFQNKVDRQS